MTIFSTFSKEHLKQLQIEAKEFSKDLQVVKYPGAYPEVRKRRPLDTRKNLAWLLAHFNAVIKYNLMTRRREISLNDQFISKEDSDNYMLAQIEYIATLNGFPKTNIDKHLDTLSLENTYHPIVECIKNKPWDGINRLDQFINRIKFSDPELSKKVVKTWMVCAIAAAHSEEGFINNGVLVLLGKQNIGKTTWVRSLDPLNCNAVKDGAFLDPSNKDSVLQLAQYWIAELGELDSIFQKSAIGRLKSFITMQFDVVRCPYAKKSIRLSRRSAYVATVNESSYLVDDTGNRRWWTVECLNIDMDTLPNMQQVWAEVFCLWKEGHNTFLPLDLQSKVDKSNKDFEKSCPLEETLLSYYNYSDNFRRELTATQVLQEIGYHHPTKAETMRMSVILREINGKKARKSGSLRLHEVPRYIK